MLGRCVSTAFRDVESLVSSVRGSVGEERNAHVFVGVGQYYNHDDFTRIVLLRLGDNWTSQRDTAPEELADIATDQFNIRDVANRLQDIGICHSVLTGELDCIQNSDWKFGFVAEPDFSIFSRQGPILQTKSYFTGPRFHLRWEDQEHTWRPDGVKSVGVEVSDEPWEDRQLLLELENTDRLTVLATSDDHTFDIEPPLARLMMTTEWLVKAGAHLCLALSRLAQFSNRPVLLLPQVLREEGNMWVQMRNKAWAKGVASQVPVED